MLRRSCKQWREAAGSDVPLRAVVVAVIVGDRVRWVDRHFDACHDSTCAAGLLRYWLIRRRILFLLAFFDNLFGVVGNCVSDNGVFGNGLL